MFAEVHGEGLPERINFQVMQKEKTITLPGSRCDQIAFPKAVVRYFWSILVEFVPNVRRANGNALMQSMPMFYSFDIQKSFKLKWEFNLNILTENLFSGAENGLMAAVDDWIEDLQSKGSPIISCNVV